MCLLLGGGARARKGGKPPAPPPIAHQRVANGTGAAAQAAEANAKAAEELEALRKEADEAGDKPPSSARLVDADGDEHPDPHDNSPRRDYGSIWDLEVEY